MKRVFTCSNTLELQAYKEALKRADIDIFVKNEYIAGAIGEVPFTEAWPEIWIIQETDEQDAIDLCQKLEQEMKKPKQEWQCHHCDEINDGSFEFFWQCEAIASNY